MWEEKPRKEKLDDYVRNPQHEKTILIRKGAVNILHPQRIDIKNPDALKLNLKAIKDDQ